MIRHSRRESGLQGTIYQKMWVSLVSFFLSPARYFCMYVCAAFVEREESRMYPRTRASTSVFCFLIDERSSSAGLGKLRSGRNTKYWSFRSIRLKDRLTNTTDPFVVRLPPAPQHHHQMLIFCNLYIYIYIYIYI